jgi:hypothetical protein
MPTSLKGRSGASGVYAEGAGMKPVDSDAELVAAADFFCRLGPPAARYREQ